MSEENKTAVSSVFNKEIETINQHVKALLHCEQLYPELFRVIDWIQLTGVKPIVNVWGHTVKANRLQTLAWQFQQARWIRKMNSSRRSFDWVGELHGVVFKFEAAEEIKESPQEDTPVVFCAYPAMPQPTAAEATESTENSATKTQP